MVFVVQKKTNSGFHYHHTIPKIYGLPKTHKPGIPLQTIISGVSTAPHNISKSLAKILSLLKNSSNLLKKNNINRENKSLASLDMKSL